MSKIKCLFSLTIDRQFNDLVKVAHCKNYYIRGMKELWQQHMVRETKVVLVFSSLCKNPSFVHALDPLGINI